MFRKLPPAFKNFYFVSIIVFVIWMTFFDSNDWINRFRMSNKLRTLKNEKEYYEAKIKEVEKRIDAECKVDSDAVKILNEAARSNK